MTKRWRCVCAYDGTDFAGWQKQPAGDAVQDKIEQALGEIFQCPTRTIGAGRTDAGVHAKAQVFHFDAKWRHDEGVNRPGRYYALDRIDEFNPTPAE